VKTVSDTQRQRLAELRRHADDFIRSITDDHSGDEAFSRACRLAELAHPYSFGNLHLIEWQTGGDSALVCGKGAFDRMAREQGHEPRTFGPSGKSWTQAVILRRGAKAVWILAPCSWLKAVTEEDTGEEIEVPVRHFRACPVYRAEDVLYCDSGEPFEVPTLLGNVATGADELMHALTAFAGAKGIAVRRTSSLRAGNDGVSYGSLVEVRGGDVAAAVHPLMHEVSHSLLHFGDDRREGERRLHEGEAESATATVLRFLGYETSLSASYLRNHRCQPDEVSRSLTRIVGAAHEIITWLREGRLVETWRAGDGRGQGEPRQVAA
jgi:hypothetical protein